MHVLYKNPGFEYSVDSIMEFLNPEDGPFWIDSLFYFYPNLNKQDSCIKSISTVRLPVSCYIVLS